MPTGTSDQVEAGPSGKDAAGDLAVIRDQTRESLELLRSLVALILSKQAVGDGPKLEEQIAALIAQQRDILVGIRQMQADLSALLDRLEAGRPPPANESRADGVGRA